jgi:transposase
VPGRAGWLDPWQGTSPPQRRLAHPDVLWAKLAPLLPVPEDNHPLGCHRKRVPDRAAMDAIFFVLRTSCQWNALSGTGICSSSSAHRRFQEWTAAGVFEEFWRQGLLVYDELIGMAVDGRSDDQGSARRGKMWAPTPPIAERAGSNGACWPTARESHWAW